jgi:hypothetical protein
MERVKVFCNDPKGLEKEINSWLEKEGDKIKITRTQDASGVDHHAIIMIFYETRCKSESTWSR